MKTIIIVLLFIPYLLKSQSTIVPYEDNYLFGFMNLDTQIVITPKYVFVRPFAKNGLAKVLEEDGQFGFIDTTGNYVIEPQYNLASSFTDHGKAVIYQNERYHLIDSTGDITLTFSQDINYINFEQMNDIGFVAGCKGYNGDAFYSWDGKIIIEPIHEYRRLQFFKSNKLWSTSYTYSANLNNDNIYQIYNPIDSSEKWINIKKSVRDWENHEYFKTAYNIKFERTDTFRLKNKNKRQINFYTNEEGEVIKRKRFRPKLFYQGFDSKKFGIIYTYFYDTIYSYTQSDKLIIKNDSVYLFPNKSWKGFLQEYANFIYIDIEYIHDNEWISPLEVVTRVACPKFGAKRFIKLNSNTGIRLIKPQMNTGNITTQARFSIDVINAQNDTLKMYSDPFPYKVYGGLLEHPKPYIFQNMVLH
ncbi:MAG: WG repeat-containing protein [Flavobacteriales bacterium]